MSIVKEKYGSNRVNLIYQILCNEAEQGQPKEYDVRIDELKVISRTSDPERFFQHEDFIQPETRCITICLYDGSSRRCTRYVLLLKEEEQTIKGTLDGIEHTINEKLQQERKQWEYEQLKGENEELKRQLDEAEEYQEQLQDTIQKLQTEKGTTTNKITDTLLNLAGLYLAKNPQALSGIPLLGDMIKPGNMPPQEHYGSASYSKQERNPPDFDAGNGTRKPKEQDVAALRSILDAFFAMPQVEKVEHIIHYLYCNNGLADELLQMLQKADTVQGEEGEVDKREEVFNKAA
ncbi:hypothetical protein [Chitinophaga polysaccharea]|uniref:hypothetical protein n=1 Tax=Chitinophaga polysaccharea TaxID=1293035 RepID=UPI001157E1DF|nr:hypothetical protein [Chitinophaga polysaccharea]